MNYFQAASSIYGTGGGLAKPSQAKSQLSSAGGRFILRSANGKKLAEYSVTKELLPIIRSKTTENVSGQQTKPEGQLQKASDEQMVITTSTVFTKGESKGGSGNRTLTRDIRGGRFKPAFPFFVIFAVAGLLFPPLLALAALSGMIWLFPHATRKTAKWSFLVLLGLFGIAFIWGTSNRLQPSTKNSSEMDSSSRPEQISDIPPSNSTGRTSNSEAQEPARKKFIGTGPTGYELWAEGNCIYVKGLTTSDLTRLQTDIDGFKSAVKSETGYKCVLFE
ncbi:hypothetical protein VB738_12830 [Cyanobium gracile UHCC 0139]|uniref:Uncharacterized protein n=1 Tax=Cyanobium gracile UHCC 0139 TaxID=3110308 RepID=A0ABU5RWQ9_9CYAN|nr:hypothetical protein [Cyanobium gracile]MEA5392143.1 hypothetical protein [Cyanobium gracile UHCC 0139]